ncbi:calcium-binding protein [Streptomyces sp. NPDC059740]|uniref:calcium-binding protein n=1 Tax=Streptomyces sp. NPDC059740 TaxID=3346926 RepID=UPI003669480C
MRTHRIIAATATLALTLGGTLLATTATAQAATADAGSLVHLDGELWYKAAPGQANDLTVSVDTTDVDPSQFGSDYLLTFRDQGDIAIDPSEAESCTYPSATDHTTVRCTVPEPLGSDDSDIYDIDLGDGDDTVTNDNPDTSATAAIHGGDGDDVIKGTGWNAYFGEGGDDRIEGESYGAWGGDGDDVLTGCSWECHGGAGNDSLTAAGGDDVPTHTLYGDAGEDTLQGGTGADVLHGGADDDKLYGAQGDDELYGEDGDDVLYGNSGNDLLHGGPGQDTLSGGPGTNKVYQD